MTARADLHVHTLHSDSGHYRRAGLRDVYSTPGEVYDAARAAGMSFVTITDRDTIDGCLRLIDERGDPPDFIVGEEVEAGLPGSPLRVHLNVWGITEAQHAEIGRLRHDVTELAGWIREERIAAAFNHFVGTLPVDLPSARTYWSILNLFDALEVRNGSQGPRYNALVAALATGEARRRPPIAFVGGSDAHTVRRVGSTWTEGEAESREGFLEEIRAGRTAAGGRVMTPLDPTIDIASLTTSHVADLLRRLRRHGARVPGGVGPAKALALLPLQIVGAPLVGTAVYFWRVRAQVRALQREIASLDLTAFRESMSSYPRTEAGRGGARP